MLSFELGREIMRRSRRGGSGGDAGAAAGSAGTSSAAAAAAKAAAPSSKAVAKPTPLQREPSERRDMFGRVVTAVPRKRKEAPSGASGGAPSGAAEPETVQQVRYIYHEGVTNAVRRTVRVQDLL